MKAFRIPAYQIDPGTLPPLLLNSEPGSFAHHTMTVRVPRIAEETVEQNSLPGEARAALSALREEILHGPARPLHEDTADRDFWNAVSQPYLGRSWLDAPWYWAEAYFYRRILEATGYFRPGPWAGRDPFAVTKGTEWQPLVAPRAVAGLLSALPDEPAGRFAALVQGSLWGNRVDLSYKHVSAQFAAHEGLAAHQSGEAANLLIDDTARVWAWLNENPAPSATSAANCAASPDAPAGADTGRAPTAERPAPRPGRGGRRIVLVADNAGTEQAMDLALIDFLLAEGLAAEVHVHLKAQPFFVSDAMPADLDVGLAALAAAGGPAAALAGRIRAYRSDGRLQVRTHWFYTTCLHFFQLPDDLLAELAAGALVICKGDANYRRLLGDAHWPPGTDFAAATAYFVAPLLALRTLKSELIVGLAPGQAEQLAQADPQWLVNGRRGVIQSSQL